MDKLNVVIELNLNKLGREAEKLHSSVSHRKGLWDIYKESLSNPSRRRKVMNLSYNIIKALNISMSKGLRKCVIFA